MLQALPWLRGSSFLHALLHQPRIILAQLLEARHAERNLVDGGVDRVLGPARGDGDLVMLDRIAAEKCDVEAAPGMTAVGHHQPEDARVEVDHLFEVEGIEANVAELGVGHRGHRRSPGCLVRASWRLGRTPHAPVSHAEIRKIKRQMPEFGRQARFRPGFFTFVRYCGASAGRLEDFDPAQSDHQSAFDRCAPPGGALRCVALLAAGLAGCGSISERTAAGRSRRPASTTCTPARISSGKSQAIASAADRAGTS